MRASKQSSKQTSDSRDCLTVNGHKNWRLLFVYTSRQKCGISLPLLNFLRRRALLQTNVNIRARFLSAKIRRNTSLLEITSSRKYLGAKCAATAASGRATSESFVSHKEENTAS